MATSKYRVLLIEDNPGDHFLIKFYLEESGTDYELVHAEELRLGIELLENERFDIVLLDLNLPDSIGLETVTTLLEKFPGLRIIVMTGHTDGQLGLQTVQMGAQDFLIKGRFDEGALNSAIRYAIERSNLIGQIDETVHEMEDSYIRFDEIQHLMGVGYFEVNPLNEKLYLSWNLCDMLDYPREEQFTLLDTLTSRLTDEKDIKETLIELKEGERKELEVTLNDKRKATMTIAYSRNGMHTTKGIIRFHE